MFENIKGKFGFGFMRLPMKDDAVDIEQTTKMVDKFMESGFNYFDTAHVYIGGNSEVAIRECLTSRYPRDKYILTNKLSGSCFKTTEDIRPFLDEQLRICGVDYFDFYLMHALGKNSFARYKELKAFETSFELKKEGKIKHVGFSFHDKPEVLEQILVEYPELEVVQLQFNYLDYESDVVEARKCLEICEKYNKPVIVMEPVKGGNLVNIPDDAQKLFNNLNEKNGTDYSNAGYALRFAESFEQVFMILSGMSDLSQVEDNLKTMTNSRPYSTEELNTCSEVALIIKKQNSIACTGCRYCVDGCPKKIAIPDLFTCFNKKKVYNDWHQKSIYHEICETNGSKASDCIKCGKCENSCPQHLEIRDLLEFVAKTFEND